MIRTSNIRALLVTVGFLISSCGISQSIDASQGTDEGPGYPASLSEGCTPQVIEKREFLFSDWASLNEVASASGVAIHGEVVSISAPRISSTKADPTAGRLDLAYFRIVDILVSDRSFALTDEAPKPDSIVEVMLLGAGPDYPANQLCFGEDSTQYPGQLPLAKGDQVIALATLWDRFPMENVNRELYFLDSDVIGVWRLDPDGLARSAIQGYEAETPTVIARIKEEFERGLVPYEDLPHNDGFSTRPEPTRPPVPSTLPPEPPGENAPDSETIPTPEDHKEILDGD